MLRRYVLAGAQPGTTRGSTGLIPDRRAVATYRVVTEAKFWKLARTMSSVSFVVVA